MEIHTYRAASLQEALMIVRRELGSEASILQTREISGRFFGLLGRPSIEVQASREAQAARRLVSSVRNQRSDESGSTRVGFTSDTAPVDEAAINETPTISREMLARQTTGGFDITEPEGADSIPWLHAQTSMDDREEGYGEPANSTARISDAPAVSGGQLSPAMFEVFTELLDVDIAPDEARTMLRETAMLCSPEQLNDPWTLKGRLCQWIQQRMRVSGPIDLSHGRRQIVALVGPTGVGKTTTLAKLAAGVHFDQGCSVGFITLDTFRLGAVDQLQKYADLLGAPCEVVSAPDQMAAALARLRNYQLILIDTAGRSPTDEAQLELMQSYLAAAQPTQIHLVLSAASSESHAELALQQFSRIEPTHLLLTKLDEAVCAGCWYRMLAEHDRPLSYLTTGQHVPEDIQVANSRRVASWILGQSHQLQRG